MNNNLELSNEGANLIKAFESCMEFVGGGRFKAYLDPVGVLTIGWGHTNYVGRKFTMTTVWTQEECDAAFIEDMDDTERFIKQTVSVPLTQYQFDAIVSFTYNCGTGNLFHSTLLRKLNAKNYEGAALEFHRWNRGGGHVLNGLTRRRASEALLFQGITDHNYDGKPDKTFGMMPQKVDAPKENL